MKLETMNMVIISLGIFSSPELPNALNVPDKGSVNVNKGKYAEINQEYVETKQEFVGPKQDIQKPTEAKEVNLNTNSSNTNNEELKTKSTLIHTCLSLESDQDTLKPLFFRKPGIKKPWHEDSHRQSRQGKSKRRRGNLRHEKPWKKPHWKGQSRRSRNKDKRLREEVKNGVNHENK